MIPRPEKFKTKAQIFYFVTAFLQEQGDKALYRPDATPTDPDYGMCAYRSRDGKKCAAGCLMRDDLVNEGSKWNTDGVNGEMPRKVLIESGVPLKLHRFVEELQGTHDQNSVGEWPEVFERLRKKAGIPLQ